ESGNDANRPIGIFRVVGCTGINGHEPHRRKRESAEEDRESTRAKSDEHGIPPLARCGSDTDRCNSQPRRAAVIAAMSIFFIPIIASNARFASSPPAASASVSTRGVICQETPHLPLHQPHALSCPPLPTLASQ